MKKDRKDFWKNFYMYGKRAVYVILGSIITAIALDIFLVPLNMAPSGASGVAALIHKLTDGLLPVGTTIILLNIPLFIAGFLYLGKKFVLGSLIGTVCYSVIIDLLDGIVSYTPKPEDKLLFAIAGGVLMGIGYGLIFKSGATTGGTDILARLMQRNIKWLTLGQLILASDITIIAIIAIVNKSIESGIYSAVIAFVTTKVVDVVEAGADYAKQLYIITSKPDEISHDIIHKLGRGVTKLDGTGMYSKKDVSVLLCVIYNKQLGSIRKIIRYHDENAFVSVTNAREATLFNVDTGNMSDAQLGEDTPLLQRKTPEEKAAAKALKLEKKNTRKAAKKAAKAAKVSKTSK